MEGAFECFVRTSNLRELLGGMSRLAGGPVLIADPSGRLLAIPACHPDSCPLLEGQRVRSRYCPVAQKVGARACNGTRSAVMHFHGVRHVVSPIQVGGRLLGFAIAEEGRCVSPRNAFPKSLRDLRLGAMLLATFIERMLDYLGAERAPKPSKSNVQAALQQLVMEEFVACPRASIKESLREAILARRLSPQGVARLRREFGLTWREVEVFVRYYLFPQVDALRNGNARKAIAHHLGITEGTLRVYLNGVRSKLGLQSRRGSLGVLLWAREEGIAPPEIFG